LRWIKPPRPARFQNEAIAPEEDTMTNAPAALAPRFAQLLAEREQELLALLSRTAESVDAGGAPGEVSDFKDAAVEESITRVDDAQATHAAHELDEVHAAMRRLQEGRYGHCEDCGDAIELQRLAALPAARYCIACQRVHEKPNSAVHR
jgi:DnaK suppressor protein